MGVTEFNVAVVLEFINDEREAVGYEYTDMANWSISSDEWLDEENSWIEEEVKPVYTYKYSDLIKAKQQYESAVTSVDKRTVAIKLYQIMGDIDTTLAGVSEAISICEAYLSELDETTDVKNAEFYDYFLSLIKK